MENNLPSGPTIDFLAAPVVEKPKYKNKILLIAIVVLCLVCVLGVAGAYYYKVGPFVGKAPYSENNLLSGVLGSLAKIKSSSYNVSASFVMENREQGAVPFVSNISDAEQMELRYKNDYTRTRDITNILYELNYRIKYQKYCPTLEQIVGTKSSYYSISIKDPKTQEQYAFTKTSSGDNFFLTVNFETDSAISQIKRLNNLSDNKGATTINGKTVIFTKDSSHIYISPTPPKPTITRLSEYLAYAPPETNVSSSISAQSNWSQGDLSDWKINFAAQGDFGDLNYKANIDALKKGNIYYIRINNLPSMFFGYLGLEKGQWMKFDSTKDSFSSLGYFSNLSKDEKDYKESRAELSGLLKNIISIADEQGLITLEKPAYIEKYNKQNLYRYDIQVRKEAIVPFYKKLQEEVAKSNLKNKYPIILDEGYVEYLQSAEFSEMFDYYQQNTNLSIFVDSNGFPVVVSYDIRLVPDDSVSQLKGKQGKLVLKLELSDINNPVEITAPVDAKDVEDLKKSNSYFQKSTDASIKSNMYSMLTGAAIYYDNNGNYNNLCSQETGYINIKKSIDKTYGSGSNVNCICDTVNCKQAKKWCASALLYSGKYYCVDFQGVKKESSNANVCSSGFCAN